MDYDAVHLARSSLSYHTTTQLSTTDTRLPHESGILQEVVLPLDARQGLNVLIYAYETKPRRTRGQLRTRVSNEGVLDVEVELTTSGSRRRS